jgi:hypothetical protein
VVRCSGRKILLVEDNLVDFLLSDGSLRMALPWEATRKRGRCYRRRGCVMKR